jgi:GT2 family glycosyltransferase
VAYGGADDLARCLGALGGEFPVTVVDNSSSPDCRRAAAAAGGGTAAYVDPGENRGFAAGVNRGLAEIGEPWPDVLVLNPDALIEPGAVRALQDHLRSAPRRAAVSPALSGLNGKRQRVCWPFPSPARMWMEAFGLARIGRQDGFLVGAVLMLRAEALADVGPFDERFFLYAEETDWQRRATEAGWEVTCCPDVTATHRGAGTSDDPALREARFHCGAETYVRKWHGTVGWQSYRAAAVVAALLRTARPAPDKRRQARTRAVVYVRGPCRHLRTVLAARPR